MKLLNRLFCLMMWVPAHQAAQAAQPFPLAGTWELVAADRLLPDGTREADYGVEPHGLMMIDSDGHYSVQIYQQGRPRFASGDKKNGTAQELRAAVEGSSTHFGRLTIDEPSRTLTFLIESAMFANWEGTRQERRYELKGNELSYRVTARPDGQVPQSVWRRIH